ncbi:hypothetical protein KRR38_22805 [Novosphingobium sp. G106]|uniref:hypothetical protein n=1 Tax=Novosphingobium sp. G106 TaxID=2849500 RepID=UPI001C2DD46F|nr:hypothetical protein [Novosphingobium sp. G106]MBV1690435.1 hypothetical protein [Novosphingobium sp. G106]
MTKQLYGYLLSSRAFMTRQLNAMEEGRVRLMKCDANPEIDVTPMALDMLRQELATVEQLIKIYGVEPAKIPRSGPIKEAPAGRTGAS